MGNQQGTKRRRLTLIAAPLTGLALFAHSTRARAEAATFQGHVRLSAPAECPSEQELSRQIAGQLSEQGARDAANFDFELAIELQAGRYRGRLRMLAPEPASEARELEDGDCANLVRASALAIAVLIGPRGALPATPPAPEPSSPPSTHALAPPDPLPPPLPVVPAPLPIGSEPEAPATITSWHLRLAAAGEVVSGMSPDAVLEPRLGLVMERVPERGARTAFGAWLRFGRSDTISVQTGDAELAWWIGRAELCRGFRASASVVAGPCLGAELGRLEASSSRAAGSGKHDEPWLGASVSVRGSVEPLPSALLFVELGGVAAFEHPTFYFQRQTGVESVYRVPLLGLSASFGAMLSLF